MPRKKSSRAKATTATNAGQTNVSRRDVMINYGLKAGLAVGLLAGGALFAADFQKKLQEQDLSAVGNGAPAIVQIHDPSCSLCASLQAQTRKALKNFEHTDLIYKVANITTDNGLMWQSKEALPHVTLIFYLPDGTRVGTIEGVTPEAEITRAIQTHLGLTPA